MAEPTHGEILAQLTEVRSELRHLADAVAALKSDNEEWKALKAGAGIARWVLVTLIAGLAMIAGVFKTLAGGNG